MMRFLWVMTVVAALCVGGTACAETRPDFDFTAWKELPVMYAGRVMPLDAFARMQLRQKDLRFSLDGVQTDKVFTAAQLKMLEKRTGMSATARRRFEPAEMLFSWIVEPEMWEHIPFLKAEKESLRKLIGLDITGVSGKRLGHVSPYELEKFYASPAYTKFVEDAERARNEHPKREYPPEVKPLVEELLRLQAEYGNFLELSFNPERLGTDRAAFTACFADIQRAWRQPAMYQGLANAQLPNVEAGIYGRVSKLISGIYEEIVNESRMKPASPDVLAEQSKLLADAAAQLAQGVEHRAAEFLEKAKTPGAVPEEILRREQTLCFMTQQFAIQTRELLFTLYENGNTLYMLPALDAAALDARRTDKVKLHPWLSLSALRFGQTDGVLSGMPEAGVKQARMAFQQAEKAWLEKDPAAFREGMKAFSVAVRALAAEVEPARETLLPEERRDAEILAATAYPDAGKLKMEVYYYRLNPFKKGWILPFVGLLFFGLCGMLGFAVRSGGAGQRTLGIIRGVCFWTGFTLLGLGVVMITYGLGLRAWIMSRAPVTNMFETVVFVALTAGVMGMWFTLRPVLDPILKRGWRASAFPWTKTAAETRRLAWVMLPLRLAVMAVIIWIFTLRGYGLGEGYNAIHLIPQAAIGATVPTLSELVIWLSGILTLVVLAWWVPRLCVAPVAACGIALGLFSSHGWNEVYASKTFGNMDDTPLHTRVLNRCWFALATALAVTVISLIPFLAPDKVTPDLRNLMPILRDNYWLSVHVMVIVGSYGAGMLAWAFANLSLLVYLFGSYHRVPQGNGLLAHRPPEICLTLSDLMYRAIQAATLMLVIGTILGGLWADVSWGRFWSWDRKEVWALITLFIYLAILHGRYVRLLGEFTLAVGSVVGALAIIMAWYGVNFVLGSSLHGYGAGSGGMMIFVVAAALNVLLILAAALRYTISTQETACPV